MEALLSARTWFGSLICLATIILYVFTVPKIVCHVFKNIGSKINLDVGTSHMS